MFLCSSRIFFNKKVLFNPRKRKKKVRKVLVQKNIQKAQGIFHEKETKMNLQREKHGRSR